MATVTLRNASDFEKAQQHYQALGFTVRHNPYYPTKMSIYLAKQTPILDGKKADKLASDRALYYVENCPVSVQEAKRMMIRHNYDCTIGHFLYNVFLEYFRLGTCEFATFLIDLSVLSDVKCNHITFDGKVPQFMSN